ncbi:hypothetical protein ATCVTN60342_408R [Acanthocystis turfacea Chlorella virus TN603.4.2]|nr:hypothetical protein ATCVTN60342_408R [Acanthocystis turfacea Chlorella virus TN603.4.2]
MQRIDNLEKKYSQELLPNQTTNMLNNTEAWARRAPVKAAVQAAVETGFLIMAYSAIIFLVGGTPPTILNLFKFGFVFLLINIAARMVSDSFSDKLAIAALSGLALKTASVMAPKIVGW